MGEIAFEQSCCDEAKTRGWINRKMTYPNRRGCPDRWFLRDGELVIVEFKKPGGVLSANQRREIRRLEDAGMAVHVVSTWAEWKAVWK